jgi:hypothetical protein
MKTVLRTTIGSSGCFSKQLAFSCGRVGTMMSLGFSRGRTLGLKHAKSTIIGLIRIGLIRSCAWKNGFGHTEIV